MEIIEFSCGEWSSGPVGIARTFRERWKGLRPRPLGHGLMIQTSSIHTFGMRSPLCLVGLAAGQRILWSRLVVPRRVVGDRRVHWMLELDPGLGVPPSGATLERTGSVGRHGGNAASVCHTDR